MQAGAVAKAVLLAEVCDPQAAFVQLRRRSPLRHEEHSLARNGAKSVQNVLNLFEVFGLVEDKLQLVCVLVKELAEDLELQPAFLVGFRLPPAVTLPGGRIRELRTEAKKIAGNRLEDGRRRFDRDVVIAHSQSLTKLQYVRSDEWFTAGDHNVPAAVDRQSVE